MAYARERSGPRGIKWQGVYRDVDGRLQSAGVYNTEAEALAAAWSLEVTVAKGTHLDPSRGRITLDVYAHKLLVRGHWDSLSETSAAKSRIKTHIIPTLGSTAIADITAGTVQGFVDRLGSKNRATGIRPKATHAARGDRRELEPELSTFRAFVREHGHGMVPERTPGLGRWVNKTRTAKSAGVLPQWIVDVLDDEPGWVWNARDATWLRQFESLRRWQNGGETFPTQSVVHDGVNIGLWWKDQKRAWDRMDPERQALLASLPGSSVHLPSEPVAASQDVAPIADADTARARSNSTPANTRVMEVRRLAPKTIRNVHWTLSSILTEAVREQLIPSNPASTTRLPVLPSVIKRAVTPEQFGCIVDALLELSPWWTPFSQIDIDAGLRWGELIGLQVEDLIGRQVHVQRTVGQGTYAEIAEYVRTGRLDPAKAHGRFYETLYPKGQEDRLVGLSKGTIKLWQTLVEERGLKPGDRLLTTPDGGYPDRATYLDDIWTPAVRHAGLEHLEHVNPHALRGASASWLLANGADLLYVMHRKGWKSVQTAAGYRGILPRDEEHAADVMDRLLDRGVG